MSTTIRLPRGVFRLVFCAAVQLVYSSVASAELLEIKVPTSPSAVKEWVKFELADPYRDMWNPDRAEVSKGYIAVVESLTLLDRSAGLPDRLLFANDRVVEPLNRGNQSGNVVAIVATPGDSADVRVWFGSRAVVEQVRSQDVEDEAGRARAITVKSVAQLKKSSTAANVMKFTNKAELLAYAAGLIRQYAPEDEAVADGYTIQEQHAYPERRQE